ncbi:hypothetical protein C8F04DRAFT_1265662 [Mycena alexandri]|uniref:Uncharacterized protein n=1 Tax=Mycena alexandri TaxID=1745969 RepID=A0AAD6WVD0_9AGAR|nr:hypothetical protein C8F04DRAFT_1265662 [Mycena alexandri]
MSRELLESFRDGAAPNLEQLEILNDDPLFYDGNPPVKMFSPGTPRLTFLKEEGFVVPIPRWSASLTHLELARGAGSESENSFFAALGTECPLLAHLDIDASRISIEEPGFRIPSLTSLRIEFDKNEGEVSTGLRVALFDTPAVTELILYTGHGDHIFMMLHAISSPHSAFPALTSLTFGNYGCTGDGDIKLSAETPYSPLSSELFPASTTLNLTHHCFMANLVTDLLVSNPQVWPLLQTVTLCPQFSREAVAAAVLNAAHSRREQALKFRVPPLFFQYLDVEEDDLDVEVLREIDSKSSSMMQHFELDHIRYGCYSP